MLRNLIRLRCPVQWAGSAGQITRLLATEATDDLERKKLVNKLLYRSKQRGFLELDLLMGLWAEQEIPNMDTQMLAQFQVVLEQENPDLFKWLTGQQQAPQDMLDNPAYLALSKHVAQQLAANSPQAAQAAAGKEWLRGWDDYNNRSSTQSTAAADSAPASP